MIRAQFAVGLAVLALAGCNGGSVNVEQGSVPAAPPAQAAQCMGYDQDGCIPICFADASCLPPLPEQAYVPTGPLPIESTYVGEPLVYDGTVPVYLAGIIPPPVPADGGTYVLANAWPTVLVTWPDGTTSECSTAYLLPAT